MHIVTAPQFQVEKQKAMPLEQDTRIDPTVMEMIADVRENGDEALFRYTAKFDQVTLEQLRVTPDELDAAENLVSSEFLAAIKQAKDNITRFHETQQETSWFMNQAKGIVLGQKVTPIEQVGVYIPGGKAAYPSTVLMNVLPAKIAGVNSVSIVTPPGPNGKVEPHVLVASRLAGADHIYKVGGAQAIAALAYGTESIAKTAKIVGPGNAYVASAKKLVYGDVAIDMIAGPSEICLVADASANARFAAADLLAQAEHDEEATALCVTTDQNTAEAIQKEIETQIANLPRQAIIQKSLQQNGRIVVAETLNAAFDLVNTIAPEHLQLMIDHPFEELSKIKNAGAIFLGNYAPEPLGDYLAGPNHTLPTSGTAVFSSPLGVYDFMKKSSVIYYSQDALTDAAEHVITLANTESLTAHARAISLRKEEYDA